MPFDKLDRKIQDAANQFEPVYNEQAWSNMEKLLDLKMPQKKNDKRRLLWIFLLLFISAGTFMFIHTLKKDELINSAAKRNSSKPSTHSDDNQLTTTTITPKESINAKSLRQSGLSINKTFTQPTFAGRPVKNNTPGSQMAINHQSTFNDQVNNTSFKNDLTGNKKNIDNSITEPGRNVELQQPMNPKNFNEPIISNEPAVKKNNIINEKEVNNSTDKLPNKNNAQIATHPLEKKNKFKNSFALNFSLGPDVSAINIGNIGKINLLYGAGINYRFGKKWNVRAGFYFAKKVYAAKTSDYHPPARFWTYYPDLQNIEANCKVLEVPLIINYNFSETSKHLWFASAGVSSYFMKKENYDYFSKNASGQNSYNSYSISNKNKHYLSSIRISGGYEKKLKNNISIIAEPYLNIPLSGVGYGKVKLYSTGILFTLSVKPFAKK